MYRSVVRYLCTRFVSARGVSEDNGTYLGQVGDESGRVRDLERLRRERALDEVDRREEFGDAGFTALVRFGREDRRLRVQMCYLESTV
jgi:hypothetical protein